MRVGQSAVIAAVRAHGPPQWKYQVYVDTAGSVVQSRDGGNPSPNRFANHLTAPDVILVGGRRTLSVLQEQTRSIPVVFAGITDPVEQGIVTNLARPGGNFTGFANFELSVFGKMLETLKQMAPNLTRVAFIFNPDNATAVHLSRSFEALAASLTVRPTLVPVHHPEEIERAIDLFAREPSGGLFFPPDATLSIHRELVIATVARRRLLAIYSDAVMVKAGGLMYYGPDRLDIFRRFGKFDNLLGDDPVGEIVCKP